MRTLNWVPHSTFAKSQPSCSQNDTSVLKATLRIYPPICQRAAPNVKKARSISFSLTQRVSRSVSFSPLTCSCSRNARIRPFSGRRRPVRHSVRPSRGSKGFSLVGGSHSQTDRREIFARAHSVNQTHSLDSRVSIDFFRIFNFFKI